MERLFHRDARVSEFYEDHPYPPPTDDLVAYRRNWDDRRRRAESHLFWPGEPYRDDRSILVAGCGTTQAAHYALRWPRAKIVGIDVSAKSIEFTRGLKHKYALDNLEVHQLAVERAAELGQRFEYVVCTGVLHHLADPDSGLGALYTTCSSRPALYTSWCMRRTGVQASICFRITVAASASARLIPRSTISPQVSKRFRRTIRSRRFSATHPTSPNKAGLADALLHPQDRSYSVPQLMDFLDRSGLAFGRWIRQAPYLPWCGALATYTSSQQAG